MNVHAVAWPRKTMAVGPVGCWLAVLLLACSAQAESLSFGTLPGKPGSAGFFVSVEMEATAGNGYQPMSLNFFPTGKAFLRDRQIEVVLEPKARGKSPLDFQYRRAVTLPEGASQWRVPIYVPHYVPWDSLRVVLWEDGQEIDTGNRSFGMPSGLRSQDASQVTLVGILTGDEKVAAGQDWETYPDLRTLMTVLGDGPLPEDAAVARLTHVAAKRMAQSVQPANVQFRTFDENQLQQLWLGYSQLDIIIVPAPVLDRIETRQPQRFQQLKSWLAAGGNLWVYAAANPIPETFLARLSLQELGKSQAAFIKTIQGTPDLSGKNDTSELFEEWNGVIKASASYARRGSLNLEERKTVYQDLKKANHPFARTVAAARVVDGVRIGSFGLGTVLTIDSADPFPGPFQFWNALVKCQEFGQTNWRERNGIDVPAGNASYWMWLIPSVGQPPVKSFVFLNALFVVLIGPVCYWVLRRRQRLYLLYFVVPALALLVTISIFAYAVGSDGTTTKVRTRQVTWVYSGNGYHVQQSRQTYYAVLGSGGGIDLPSETAVFPVRHTPALNRYNRNNGESGRLGVLRIADDRQFLDGSFLPPRDQVQYLTIRPIQSDLGVTFQLNEDGASVRNGLSVAMQKLLVRDANGVSWQAENLAAGDTTLMRRADNVSPEQILGPQVLPPLGEVPMLRNNVVRIGGGMAGVQVGQLERRLESWSKRLPNGTFVAIADLVDERIGVEGSKIMDSVHVVLGELE